MKNSAEKKPDSSITAIRNEAKQIAYEQSKVDLFYNRLDQLIEEVKKNLDRAKHSSSSGTHQNRGERDAFVNHYEDLLAKYNAVKNRLVFGKLDFENGETRYIGRLTLRNDEGDILLTDWRADAAVEFYRATQLNPANIASRRHIILDNRKVTGVEDEILNLDSEVAKRKAESNELIGEATFFNTLRSARTSKMNDIVSSIQVEQDRIIRAPMEGVLIIQGGPGTGKTAVALHRAAYLLYDQKQHLEQNGVLVIGPNNFFLKYIDQVLPSLGEAGVKTSTITELGENIQVGGNDSDQAIKIKSSLQMVTIIKRAVLSRKSHLKSNVTFDFEGMQVHVYADVVNDIFDEVALLDLPHNHGWKTFNHKVIASLTNQIAEKRKHFVEKEEKDLITRDLVKNSFVKSVLNLAWQPINAQRLIHELWSKPHRLVQVANDLLSADEMAHLYQPPHLQWSIYDLPLIDEARTLLGDINEVYEEETADKSDQTNDDFTGLISTLSGGIVSASMLNERYNTIFENKEHKKDDIFGHIIVDEAQELTPMQWRMLKRRCPTTSFTIVGDVAQTASLTGSYSWEKTIEESFNNKASVQYLTTNYRNPAAIAAKSMEFAKANGLDVLQKVSTRDEPNAYVTVSTNNWLNDTIENALNIYEEYISRDGTGRICIIASACKIAQIQVSFFQKITERFGAEETARLDRQTTWDTQVVICDPDTTKGLEFDAVLLVEPDDYLPLDKSDLRFVSSIYVAMTRPTRKLIIVHEKPLLKGM